MSKRDHTGQEKPLRCVEVLEFSKQSDPSVVPLDELIGCRAIIDCLDAEIGVPLRNGALFELNGKGLLPVNRFFRFFGVEGSSKRTAVLSFAMHHKIDVFLVRSSLGFRPARHLPELYEKLRRYDKPGMIVFSNVEHLFFEDPSNILAFSHCLQRVHESQFALWTIMTTSCKTQLPFSIDKFFAQTTMWNGLSMHMPDGHVVFELFSPLDRMKILSRCIAKYTPDKGSFPWPDNHELVLFVEKYTAACTFGQIEQFVRRAFHRRRQELVNELRAGIILEPAKLVPTKNHFFQCLAITDGGFQSISLYPARAQNIELFVGAPD